MYRASDRLENEEWLSEMRAAAEELELSEDAWTTATDLFLSGVPEEERSKPAAAAASLYAGALIAGDQRSQSAIADAMDVARLSVQQRWKPIIEDAGFEPPTW